MIFFVLFAMWLIFNGKITMEIIIIGLIFSFVLYRFCLKHLGYADDNKKYSVKRTLYLIQYLGILIWEIIKANIQVIKMTVAKELDFEPCLIYFKTDLKDSVSRVMLANSITLTPGTITVSLDDDTYCVHCLDKSMAEGIDESIFVQKLRRLEEI